MPWMRRDQQLKRQQRGAGWQSLAFLQDEKGPVENKIFKLYLCT
jgi:hypothetical protein